jgi:hypothetical protein
VWFTETPWPPIMICAAGALLLIIAWFRNARPRFLYAIAGLAVLSLAIFLVEKMVVTDVETVEQHTLNLAEAVRLDDAKKAVSYMDSIVTRLAVKSGMSKYQVSDDISITDISARWNDEGTKILAHFRANGTAREKPNGSWFRHIPTRWELTWKKDDKGEWKISDIQRLDPIKGDKIGYFDAP